MQTQAGFHPNVQRKCVFVSFHPLPLTLGVVYEDKQQVALILQSGSVDIIAEEGRIIKKSSVKPLKGSKNVENMLEIRHLFVSEVNVRKVTLIITPHTSDVSSLVFSVTCFMYIIIHSPCLFLLHRCIFSVIDKPSFSAQPSVKKLFSDTQF